MVIEWTQCRSLYIHSRAIIQLLVIWYLTCRSFFYLGSSHSYDGRNSVHFSSIRGFTGPPTGILIDDQDSFNLYFQFTSDKSPTYTQQNFVWGHASSHRARAWRFGENFVDAVNGNTSWLEGSLLQVHGYENPYLVLLTRRVCNTSGCKYSVRTRWTKSGYRALRPVQNEMLFALLNTTAGSMFYFNNERFFSAVVPNVDRAGDSGADEEICRVSFSFLSLGSNQIMALPAGSVLLSLVRECRRPHVIFLGNKTFIVFSAFDKELASVRSAYVEVTLEMSTESFPIPHPSLIVQLKDSKKVTYFDYGDDAVDFVFSTYKERLFAIGWNGNYRFPNVGKKDQLWRNGMTVIREIYEHNGAIYQKVMSEIVEGSTNSVLKAVGSDDTKKHSSTGPAAIPSLPSCYPRSINYERQLSPGTKYCWDLQSNDSAVLIRIMVKPADNLSEGKFKITLSNTLKETITLGYDPPRWTLSASNGLCQSMRKNGVSFERNTAESLHSQLTVLIDKNVVEAFLECGRYVITQSYFSTMSLHCISFETLGDRPIELSASVETLIPIWSGDKYFLVSSAATVNQYSTSLVTILFNLLILAQMP